MRELKIIIFCFLLALSLNAFSQIDSIPVFKGAIIDSRTKLKENLIRSINRYLSQPLKEETEEDWESAFWTMEVLQYRTPFVVKKITEAFDSIEIRSIEFQRSLLELAYANYPKGFKTPVANLLKKTGNDKIFAMCGEYLLRADTSTAIKKMIIENAKIPKDIPVEESYQSFYYRFLLSIQGYGNTIKTSNVLKEILSKNFLPGNVVAYSFQRKNRNYPGLTIVRDTAGNFIKTSSGAIMGIPQLARSISNLPYYLTNGNTPQGIYRMYGFDVSRSSFIGPTANIQLTMPYETSLQHFLNDSTITDSVWTKEWYKKLLPESLQNYEPLFESYYASACGRTEIIAHGTTVDPDYYKGKVYYPQTPTQGCLATKEIWSGINGKRLISDQQKLADSIKKAGGARGYYIVIELDDKQTPVKMEEIFSYIK